jgi:hypothetical protein
MRKSALKRIPTSVGYCSLGFFVVVVREAIEQIMIVLRILSANFAAKLQNIMQTANNIGRKKTMTDNFYLFPEMTLKTRYFDDASASS